MSIRMSGRMFVISIILLTTLFNKSASAQYYDTQANQSNAPLELNPFLHGATTAPRNIPTHQITPVLQYAPEEQPGFPALPQPQSEPERPQASQLAGANPSGRKQRAIKRASAIAVKHDLPVVVQRKPLVAKAAGGRPAPTDEIKIAQTLAQPTPPPSPQAAMVSATEITVSAPVPADIMALAGQIQETANAVTSGVRIVSADEFTELDRAADGVRIVPADELNDLDLAAGPPVQTGGSKPAEARPMPTRPAPSATSALRAVLFGLGVPMVVGFLAWPFLARNPPRLSHLKYRARLHIVPRLRALRDQCGAAAATVWTSTKNGSCTSRSMINNVLGG
jgi:hypothetical protein